MGPGNRAHVLLGRRRRLATIGTGQIPGEVRMEPVDLDRVNFRQRRHLPPSVTEQGTPFWRIVGAVLTALLLFGVIQAVIAYAMYRHALSEAERILSTLKGVSRDTCNLYA